MPFPMGLENLDGVLLLASARLGQFPEPFLIVATFIRGILDEAISGSFLVFTRSKFGVRG